MSGALLSENKRIIRINNKKYNPRRINRTNKKDKTNRRSNRTNKKDKTNRRRRRNRRMRGGAMTGFRSSVSAGHSRAALEPPIFLVTNGPTGAGKSSLPLKICKKLGIPYNKSEWEFALVDDLVENSDVYKGKVVEIIQGECNDVNLCDNLREKLDNPKQEMIDKFTTAYFDTRKGPLKLDDVNDLKIKTATEQAPRKNIVLEMVGDWAPTWMFEEKDGESWAKTNGIEDYRIIFAWSLASMCSVMERNKSRAVKDMTEFIADKSGSAPRLPDIRDNGRYNDTQDRIMNTLGELITRCHEADDCLIHPDNPKGNIERVIVFDNTHQWCVSALANPDLMASCDEAPVVYDSASQIYRDMTAAAIITGINDLVKVAECKRTQAIGSPVPQDAGS